MTSSLSLTSAIKAIENWQTITIEELAHQLNIPSVRRKTFGDVSISLIANQLGTEAASLVLYTLEKAIAAAGDTPNASLYRAFLTKLSVSTVDMTHEDVRTAVQMLGAKWPDGLVNDILALGYVLELPCGRYVTTLEVCDAVQFLNAEARRYDLRMEFAELYNEALRQLELWDGSTPEPKLELLV